MQTWIPRFVKLIPFLSKNQLKSKLEFILIYFQQLLPMAIYRPTFYRPIGLHFFNQMDNNVADLIQKMNDVVRYKGDINLQSFWHRPLPTSSASIFLLHFFGLALNFYLAVLKSRWEIPHQKFNFQTFFLSTWLFATF